jgi:hypothetical protein
MAKMMPSFILDDHGSGAERKVFDWFKKTTEDWVGNLPQIYQDKD